MKKILFIGTRGIPANYGGFETCVEEVATRMALKYRVIVYARRNHYSVNIKNYKNVEIVMLPSMNLKSLETLSHTFFAIIHGLIFHKSAVWLIFNAANGPLLIIPWLFRVKMAINTDGLEWKRDKWGKIGKCYYQIAEWVSTKLVKNIITDNKKINEYYANRWSKKSKTIEYGAYIEESTNKAILKDFNVEQDKYFLQITRLEPDNNPLLSIEAYLRYIKQNPKSNHKLVIIGDVTYPSTYSKIIKSFRDDNIIIPGPVFEKNTLKELRTNCFAYIHGNQVGGTNPALLEAMGSGAFVIARNVSFNREVLGNGGIYYERKTNDLANKMDWVWKNSKKRNKSIDFSINKIKNYYNWDRISNEYEFLIEKVIKK